MRREGFAAREAEFKRSAFQGRAVTPAALASLAGNFCPRRGQAAEAQRFLLERVNGTATNAELAAALRTEIPQAFPSDAAALARVVDVTAKLVE